MGEGFKNWFAKTSSSLKVILFAVLLVLVSGSASLFVQRRSNLALIYAVPTSSSSNTNLDAVQRPSLHAKESDSPVDLHSEVVVLVDDHSRKEALSDEAALSKSVSPTIDARSLQVQQFVRALFLSHGQSGRNEDNPNMSISENFSSTTPFKENESIDPPLKHRRRRVYTKLDRLEDGLRKARAAIKEAMNWSQLQDPDYIPSGPIYRNAKCFHRSYLEMEKKFKIYVYKEGELPLFHDGPCRLLYTMEGQFINKKEGNIPSGIEALALTISCFLAMTGGLQLVFDVPDLVKNSIRALCNANTSERFNPKKDVSIPEISLKSSRLEGLIGGPSPSQRTILAFFAGGNHGFVRPILFRHWEKKDPDIRVHNYLPKRVPYYDLMRQSKYCLCPSGYEVASPRVVEALYNGCVPVLISKSWVPPFSDVLNWKMFSVMVSLEDIPNLKKILMSIPERQYIKMQKRVVQVRRHFELHVTPKRFDVFHMILHSIWLRRLNVKVSNEPGNILD
ncbi:hypothetical protein QUC31_011017 [Theobroma cacao]